ncbi:MAG: DUF4298 domain-containing protein [Bacteroidaceae bacterium]|jgi:hypothetical protein|nr:DUF4298 domain-containing protein [Bacteroidaceae bacterium]
MEQIERIKRMERCLDQASAAVMELSAALDQYMAAQEAIHALEAYYGSDWRKDFEDDVAGLLPKDLKRGVLSEDGIWNLLADNRQLNRQMQEVVKD